MSTSIVSKPAVDLQLALDRICAAIGFVGQPPSIAWEVGANKKVSGRYKVKENLVLVSDHLDPAYVDEIIVHELCHALLYRVGYRCTSHSWVFLTVFDLLLRRAGVLVNGSSVEGCAVANWNRATPWPWWYKHVVKAQDCVREKLVDGGVWLSSASAEQVALAVVDHSEQRLVFKWLSHRWHEVIADTRGNWFALLLVVRTMFFVSFLLIGSGYPVLVRCGVYLFCASFIGFWIVGTVFKLKQPNSSLSI